MAKFQFKGLEEYAEKLQLMSKNTKYFCGSVVYEMADIVADKVREKINALPTISNKEAIEDYKAKRKTQLTKAEKKGLQDGFGITKMKSEKGYYYVKLGFDGYNTTKTKKYPKGQPNVMIARATESGSSVRDKHPFIRPAVKETKELAVKRAQEMIDEECKKVMEG